MTDADLNERRDAHLEKIMFKAWLKNSGESNDSQIEHLKNCIHIAIKECLTEKQRKYLSMYLCGYNQLEISKITAVNKSTVSRTLTRAINNLMGHIKYATPATLRAEKRVRKALTRLYK